MSNQSADANDDLGDNFFRHYSYALWAPQELQKLYPDVESALAQLETSPHPEAAFSVFWNLLDPQCSVPSFPRLLVPDEIEAELKKHDPGFQLTEGMRRTIQESNREIRESTLREGIPARLAALVQNLRPVVVPDEPVLDFDAWVFGPTSAALAVSLERFDSTQSERLWEVVENALRVLKRPTTGNFDVEGEFAFELFISDKLVQVYLWSKLFHKHYAYGEYERALECLVEAVYLCAMADNDLYDCLNDCQSIDDWMSWAAGSEIRWRGSEVLEPGPGIMAAGAGCHLIAFLVPAQKAVDAFDQLLAASLDGAKWAEIAKRCSVIQQIWEEPTPNPMVQSKFWRPEQTTRDFWVMARGLALQKMSPDALARVLQESKRLEGETRLRTYFFGDSWNKLPQAAKDRLINADRLFYSQEGARPGIFNELRLACEAILEAILWEPYHAWFTNRPLKDMRNLAPALDHRRSGTFLGQMLEQLWGASDFSKFVAEKCPTATGFIYGDLKKALNEMLNLRNPAEHPQRGSRDASASQIRDVYMKFLGIGQPGILQKLIALETKH